MSAERPATPSSGGGAGGKLENLSKEDLIKFAKRQTMMMSKAKAKIDELSKKTDGTGEIHIVLQQKDELEGQLNVSRQKMEILTQQKEALAHEKETWTEEREKLKQENKTLLQTLEKVNEELTEVQEKFDEADEERQSAVEAYQSMQTTLERTMTDKTNHLQTLEEKISQLTNQIVALREENECLKMQHTSTLESAKSMQLEHQKMCEEKTTLSTQLEETKAELKDTTTLKDKLVVNFKVLKQKYLEMKKELTDERADSPRSLASPEPSPRAMASPEPSGGGAAGEERRQLEADIETLRHKCDSQTEELTSLRGECDQLKESLTQMTTDQLEASSAVQRLTDENESLCQQLSKSADMLRDKNTEMEDCAAAKAVCEVKITELLAKIETLRTEYEESARQEQAKFKALTEEVEELKANQAKSKSRMEELVLGLGKESAGIISQYEKKIEDLEAERDELKKTLTVNANADSSARSKENSQPCVEEPSVAKEDVSLLGAAAPLAAAATVPSSNQIEESEVDDSPPTYNQLAQSLQVLKAENKSLKSTRAQVDGKPGEGKSKEHKEEVAALFEHIRVIEISRDKKDKEIEQLGVKLSELVDYSSKLKAKCKILLETNEQLSNTVQQQERRLLNDARGARNLELHLQETENNVNEQIAHFHEERDQMIARVQEYAANIERLRSEMMPFKQQEKECVKILYQGLQKLLDQKDEEDDQLPMSNLVGLSKLLVTTALKFKMQFVLVSNKLTCERQRDMMQKMILSWKFKFAKESKVCECLREKITRLEQQIKDLGGELEKEEEDIEGAAAATVRPPTQNFEKMEDKELEDESVKINEEEIQKLYKYNEECERKITAIKKEKDELMFKCFDAIERLNKEHAAKIAELSPDANPDEKPAAEKPKPVETVSSAIQTEVTSEEMEDEAIHELRETIIALRAELRVTTDVSDELAALKNERGGAEDRIRALVKELEEVNAQKRSKESEIEHLSSIIQRHRDRIEQQTQSLEDLNIQLNKKSIQEKFHVKVGDSRHENLQASLSQAIVDLQKSKQEVETLRSQLDDIKSKQIAETASVPELQSSLAKSQKDNEALGVQIAELNKDLESLSDTMALLEATRAELDEVKAKLDAVQDAEASAAADLQASLDKSLEENRALVSQNTQLTEQLDSLSGDRKMHEATRIELEDLKSKLDVTQKSESTAVTSLQASLDKALEENQALGSRNTELTKELESLSSDRMLHETSLAEANDKLELQKSSIDILSDEKAELLRKIEDLHDKEKEMQLEKEELVAEKDTFQRTNEELVAQATQLRAELEASTSRHEELRQKQTSLSEKLKEVEEAHAEKVAEWESEAESYVSRVAELTQLVNQHEAEQLRLTEEVSTQRQANEELRADVENGTATAQKMKHDHEADVSQLKKEYESRISASDADYRQQISVLNSQMESLRKETDNLQMSSDDMAVLRSSQESLAKQYEGVCATVEKLDEEKKKLNSIIDEKENQLQNMSMQQSVLNEKIETLQSETEALASEKSQLQQTIASSKTQIEEFEVAASENRSEIDRLNAAIALEQQQHQQSVENISAELKTATTSMRELQQTNQRLVEQSEGQQRDLDRATNQVVDLQQELETARKEMMETSVSNQTSSSPSEDMAANDAKLKEMEDRANKFKLLALKAKKELVESKSTIEKLKGELKESSGSKVGDMQTLMSNYQHLQQEFDKLQDDLDTAKSRADAIQGQFEEEKVKCGQLQGRVTELLVEREDMSASNSQLHSKVKALESQHADLKSAITALEKESDMKQNEILELNRNLTKMSDQSKMSENSNKSLEDRLRAKINELELKVHEARDELEQANKTMSKSSVMDLEIADFERTVSRLGEEIKEKAEVIENLEQELEHQKQKFSSLEHEMASADEQRLSVESRFDKLQQMLNKTKQELEEAKQQETEIKTTDLAVRGELEVLRQQFEDSKLEISRLSAEKLAVDEKLRSSQDSQHRLMRSMENKQRALQTDLESSRKEVTTLHQEYDSYKVRVHSVLKQQQTRASVEAALESEKVEKAHLQEVLTQVKVKLQDTSDKLQAALSESGLLQDELDKLSLKHNKLTQEYGSKETVWRQRLDQLMLENSTISAEHSAAISQMGQHTEIMTQTFKEQMKASQSEHEHQLANLNSRIDRLENEKASLAVEVQTVRQQLGSSNKSDQHKTSRQHSRQQAASPPIGDAKYRVRESGEGMEHPNPSQKSASLQATTPQGNAANTLTGLEHLLTSAEDDAVSVVSLGSATQASEGGDEAKLRSRLHLSEKQLEHLRELLNDSEATCMRYNEQVKLLKQEVRRLESNQQRETSISNMEYLKNIVYKFVSLEPGDEKSRLVVVLNAMLKFTDEELSFLKAIATSGGDAEAVGQGQAQGSWSGYLHRWTGFSS